VETSAGERYTRAGDFTVNGEGYLVTQDGNYVLGESGRIYAGSDGFTVSADGTVTGSPAGAQQLKIVTFGDTGALRKEGNNLYYAYDGAPAIPVSTWLGSGALESSNMDVSSRNGDMISVYRKYEASQKMPA
jgi:flagellar basal body rod protein FlgG